MDKQIDQVAVQKMPACLMGVLCLALLTLLAGGSAQSAQIPKQRPKRRSPRPCHRLKSAPPLPPWQPG